MQKVMSGCGRVQEHYVLPCKWMVQPFQHGVHQDQVDQEGSRAPIGCRLRHHFHRETSSDSRSVVIARDLGSLTTVNSNKHLNACTSGQEDQEGSRAPIEYRLRQHFHRETSSDSR